MVLRTKANAFQEYLNNITKSDTYGTAFKIVKDILKVNVLSHQIIKADGSITENDIESRRVVLKNSFYSDVVNETSISYIDAQDNIYNNDINPLEIEWVIRNLQPNKATGYDGMTTEIIKYLYNSNPDLFYDIINSI